MRNLFLSLFLFVFTQVVLSQTGSIPQSGWGYEGTNTIKREPMLYKSLVDTFQLNLTGLTMVSESKADSMGIFHSQEYNVYSLTIGEFGKLVEYYKKEKKFVCSKQLKYFLVYSTESFNGDKLISILIF